MIRGGVVGDARPCDRLRTGGGAGMFLRPRQEAGDAGWARPDISAVGALATQNGTWGVFGGDSSRWLAGRLKSLAGGGTGQVNLDFYGLGESRPSFDQPAALQQAAAIAQGNWRARARIAMVGRPALRLRERGAASCATRRCCPCPTNLSDRVRVDISGHLGADRDRGVRHARQCPHAASLRRRSYMASARGAGRERGLRALRSPDPDGPLGEIRT